MLYFKIFALCSCLVGVVQICGGLIMGSAPALPPNLTSLFNFYGILGSFGELELIWLGLSIIATIFCVKQSISPLPPLCYVAFCLIHPIVSLLIPASAFGNDSTAVNRFIPAVIELFFGLIYVVLNVLCYKNLFFTPQLFEKTQ